MVSLQSAIFSSHIAATVVIGSLLASLRTLNDEYWHVHIDKLQYGSFVFTGLLYLSDYEVDFDGGAYAVIYDLIITTLVLLFYLRECG